MGVAVKYFKHLAQVFADDFPKLLNISELKPGCFWRGFYSKLIKPKGFNDEKAVVIGYSACDLRSLH